MFAGGKKMATKFGHIDFMFLDTCDSGYLILSEISLSLSEALRIHFPT